MSSKLFIFTLALLVSLVLFCDSSVDQPPTGEDGIQVTDGTCCPDGDCICRGSDPITSSSNNGPYTVQTFTFAENSYFGGATVYYPTDAEAPYSSIVYCPPYLSTQSVSAAWGPFFASWGIVFVNIDTLSTGDQVPSRAEQQAVAIEQLKAEHTRSGSPLYGKLSNRRGVMGWSMGGGASWMNAADNATLKSSVTLAGHNVTAGGASIAEGTMVPSLMLCGETDTDTLGGGDQSQNIYNVIPETTSKLCYEFADVGHMAWGGPTAAGIESGEFALAFQKTFLDGDSRWKKFLLTRPSNASDWLSNIK